MPKIANIPIARKQVARFLGVSIDERLTWDYHISAIKTKMSCYIGILYKLKTIVPLAIRKTIYHSFVQSHINYCSLVWGLGKKSKIETIFTVQKKAIRAVISGNVNSFYKNGQIPTHTKPSFTEFAILTVHNIILKNALLFMYKIHKFPHTLPQSVKSLISEDAPIPGSDHDTCQDWLSTFGTHTYSSCLMYKGPLFYSDMMPSITNSTIPPRSLDSCKIQITRHLRELQSSGNSEEWSSDNFKLTNVPGLRRSQRDKTAVKI